MKHLIPVILITAVAPSTAYSQIDVVLDGARPVLRANVGGVVVSATLGSRGVEWSVGEGTAARRTERTRTRTRTSASAAGVLATADSYVGTKYVWGGETPNGFDCSGFVQYVFREHGIELPRTSRQQAQVGEYVSPSRASLRAGDLMLFATNGSRIDHVAIYAGNGEMIHSSSSGGGVAYDDLSSKRGRFFLAHHVATRRVLENGQSLVGPLTAALRAVLEFDPPDRAPKRF